MRSNFHKPPPPPKDFDPDSVRPLVKEEAKRQFDEFHSAVTCMKETNVRLAMIENGIFQMLKQGAAKVTEEGIRFWEPLKGEFVPYDSDYNSTMLSFMQEFKAEYKKTQTDKYDD